MLHITTERQHAGILAGDACLDGGGDHADLCMCTKRKGNLLHVHLKSKVLKQEGKLMVATH